MKTITASWMISCALLCACSATSGSDGDNGLGGGVDGPASDSFDDGNRHDIKPLVPIQLKPSTWQVKPIDYGKVIDGVPLFPDPEQDSGPAGEEGSSPGGSTEEPTLPTVIPPTIVDGNPKCADVFDGPTVAELDVTTLRDGTYTSSGGSFSVTLDFTGTHVTYTTSGGLLGVLVKGGPHANFYRTTSQTGDVTTAAGEDISHVTFCYAAD